MLNEVAGLERFVARPATAWDKDLDTSWMAVPGSLCFVDISGFTQLSERLATRGRVGAEELTEVLNRVFGSMLDLARDRRGELLKYGGDALLLLFEGDEHPMQAASAAVEMRAALRDAAEIATSVGRVALRMSVGVHSGRVHLFRAVGTHTELMVTGPAASTVAQMEAAAEAGEIVVSPAALERLPTGSAIVRRGGGWLLRWRKPRVAPCGQAVSAETDDGLISRSIPTALQDYLSVKRSDSEHRLAAVAFVEFVGVDDLLETEDPETVGTALSELVDAVTTIADEEGVTFLGTDVDANGGKIILVSGVPATQIDEGGRILRSVRRIADVETPFGLKIGVNRGHVFAGEIGTEHRSTFTVMGDTVNLAARLMAAAPPGYIYATPGLVDESLTLFETTELEPIAVKGKSRPVDVAMVGAEIGPRSARVSERLPFTGRSEELDIVMSSIGEVQRGRGGTVFVSGPTGIGKTRLVDEALGQFGSGIYVVEVRAEPYGAASPYRPFRDEVRRILSVDRDTNEKMSEALLSTLREFAPDFLPYAPLVGDVAQIDVPETAITEIIDPKFRQARIADTIVELLSGWTEEPLVIVAEDVHWADPASLALLERLEREAEAHSWLVMSTSREEQDTYIGRSIVLEPLDALNVEELVYGATELSPLRSDEVAVVVERSGGNPLFVQELLRIVGETGDLSTLPTSLDGVVGSQIDALAPSPRQALRYISVLGRSFRTSIARSLLATQGVDLTDSVRETLNGFLEDDGSDRLRFRHALVRDVAYEGLPFRRRRDLHLRAGTLILESSQDEDAILDVLSLHFSLGGDRELSWKYSLRAGDRNMDAYANLEAETEFERAIDAARYVEAVNDTARMDVWTKLGYVREQSGKFVESLDAYRHATRLTGDDLVAKAGVMLKCARAKERSGAFSAALSEATRARHLAQRTSAPGARQVVARALGITATIRQAQEKPRSAITAALAAIDAAEVADDDDTRARAWMVMDYAHAMLGELDLAVHSENALQVFKDAGDLSAVAVLYTNLGAFAYWRGDWAKALEYYERGRGVSEQVGNMVDAAGAAANIGEVLVNQGRFAEAEEPLRAARRIYLGSAHGEGVGFTDVLIGRMHGIEGRLKESEHDLRRSIAALEELGLGGSTLEAEIYLADAACRAGSPERGLRILSDAGAVAPPEYVNHYQPLLARIRGSILASSGQTAEAIAELKIAIASASERGDAYELSVAVLNLDRVSPDQTDDASRQEARKTLRTLGVRSVPGISLFED
jgi:class 3 adenylate cyclase/tetratricopeptide (TPR) repeat protein